MRKYTAILSLILLILQLTACEPYQEVVEKQNPQENDAEDNIVADEKENEQVITEITMWTFPVGEFGKQEVVEGFVANFQTNYPEIKVKVEVLDYETGDARIEEAIESRTAPDIIMEGPERLVANWGARGLMIDLEDMWDEETNADIAAVSQEIVDACQAPDGAFYQYPMVMTTHVMAINYEVFKEADALQYIDEETRSWTTGEFVAAMEAVRDSELVNTPGVIYSGGQGGDQGTRALVTNLYNASFTNEDHNSYTINEERGVQGLNLLLEMVKNGSLSHDSQIVAADELQMFATEETAITLAWNATNELLYAENTAFTPFAMNFPSIDGIAELQGGIWGFGILNNGNEEKVDASKKLIGFLVNDPVQRVESIRATQFFPVKQSCGDVYSGTEDEVRMDVYTSFLPNLGDYYQVTQGWTQQRVAWYQLLQQLFVTEAPQSVADQYAESLNPYINP